MAWKHTFQVLLILLAVLAGTALVARRIDVAPAILLLLAGIALAFVPGMPAVELPPQLVLLVVLPPLIYSASVAMSWREFKFNLRPIILLSVGCVIFTATAVAVATHYLIGLPWNIGFLLGAIVAPPDVVAPLAIARKLRLPRRILVVLEGEGLANDATALILYRFALAAIATGAVFAAKGYRRVRRDRRDRGAVRGRRRLAQPARSPSRTRSADRDHAVADHPLPRLLGARAFRRLRRDRYCGLRPLHQLEWTVVDLLGDPAAGHLLLGPRDLPDRGNAVPFDRRPDALAVREVESVFARRGPARDRIGRGDDHHRALRLGFSRDLSAEADQAPARRDPSPPWQWVFVLAFTGVRGAVSLAAALALPFALPGGDAFPYRDLIQFVTFGVILITLVGLGLGLPLVVRWLGIAEAGRDEHKAELKSEIAARREALGVALQSLDDITDDRELSDEVVKLLRARHETRFNQLPDSLDPDVDDVSAAGIELTRELIAAERKFIHTLLREGKITDEIRRRIERDLDLEEASLANREYRR